MHDFLHNSFVRSAIAGLVAAAIVDVHAFMKFQDVREFAKYSWGIAAFRWVQGAVGGLITAAGISLT